MKKKTLTLPELSLKKLGPIVFLVYLYLLYLFIGIYIYVALLSYTDCTLVDGTEVPSGEQFTVDCNTCLCLNGSVGCSSMVCDTCKCFIK